MTTVALQAFCATTKSDKTPPAWLKNTPKSTNGNYTFKVVMVDNGKTLPSSRQLARAELTRSIQKEFNIQISEELTNTSNTNQTGGNIDYTDKETYVLHVKSEEKEVAIHCERIDEYYEIQEEDGVILFKLYTLFAVSDLGTKAQFDEFRLTTKYGARGLWRSAICPGWRQMYKGSTAKGISILVAELAAIGGIIFTENERASYESKMRTQPSFAKQYKTKMDNYETARNCCIGAAAAIYVYNLIDAIVAPGARRVSVTQRNFTVTPKATRDFNGLSFSYRF